MWTTPTHKLSVSINGLRHCEYTPQLVNDRFTSYDLLVSVFPFRVILSFGTDNRT